MPKKSQPVRVSVTQIFATAATILVGAMGEATFSYNFTGEESSLVGFVVKGTFYFACAIAIVLIHSFTSIMRVQQDLVEQRAFRVTIQKDDARRSKHGTAYVVCTAAALEAKNNITVIGPHFTPDAQLQVGTTSHDHYLTEGMEKAVRKHTFSTDEDADFSYTRIVQLDTLAQNRFNECDDHRIPAGIVGNATLAKHIERMLKLNRASHTVDVKIYARQFIPSFPSTLIIDDRYVFFSLPSMVSATTHTHAGKIDALKASLADLANRVGLDTAGSNGHEDSDHGLTVSRDEVRSLQNAVSEVEESFAGISSNPNSELKYDFVLAIEDSTGTVPRAFRQMVTQFEIDSKEIKGVDFSAAQVGHNSRHGIDI